MLVVTLVTSTFASAAQVSERSIQLSSSSAGASNVTYNINFTPVSSAQAFVIDFCTDSPLIGEACNQPDGFTVASATTASSGFTASHGSHGPNTTQFNGAITGGTPVNVVVEGVHNPTDPGTLYARIVTYDTTAHADSYTSTTPGTGVVDNGGVAMSITPTISVSGAVLESMTFCVSADNIDLAGCTKTGGGALAAPNIKLGRTVGEVTVLDDAAVYDGTIYTQLSTNASGGAIVRLKSSTTGCGGLMRAGEPDPVKGCGIAPALTTGITQGQAKFGVKTGTAVGVVGNTNGTLRSFNNGAYYDSSTFKLNYVSGDATGVTSTYGDSFLDTNDAPLSNVTMPITFGASANSSTTAGRYSADLSLIATGKF